MSASASAFDAVVAGAGIAGCAAAASLASLGHRVLVVDPGMDYDRRLAGELMHPPGVNDLAELGLLNAVLQAGGVPIVGFAVYSEPEARHTADDVYVLPYDEVPGLASRGYALEHGALVVALQRVIAVRPGVSLELGSRVSAVEEGREHVRVTVTDSEGRARVLRTPLLVVADGRTSALRKVVGIGEARLRLSSMAGYLLEGAEVPHPHHGHVFFGGHAPVLAYPVSRTEVRVMLDVPGPAQAVARLRADPAYADGVPGALGERLRAALREGTPLVSANFTIVPERVGRERLVLVGDAAGCCHPLTATGLSIATRDALRLRRAFEAHPGDVPRAALAYCRLRAGPQRTRLALTDALYEAFTSNSLEMRFLRRAILRYWRQSPRGRAASLALLSTQDGRMSALARQYARVVGFALPELVRLGGGLGLGERAQVIAGLLRKSLSHARAALKSPAR